MDIISSKKISDTSIEITTQPKMPNPIVETYNDRVFLEKQLVDIQAQWDSQVTEINKARQAEVDKAKAILKAMDDLGIKPKEE